jgi:methylenetetrahydrofolate dehydrogenase (NADP+)/methenyltetrahydrofolate cyclohydrolase
MSAQIIDGKKAASLLRGKVEEAAKVFIDQRGRPPGLAVILLGDDPASQIYVASKIKQTSEAGMRSIEHRLSGTTSEPDLLDLIEKLNQDETIDGILVQLPLPKNINTDKVILKLRPDKDVDGLHPENAGRLACGLPGLVPCTPLGCLQLLQSVHDAFDGLNALIIGRSNLVGKPMAQLLLAKNATVTIAHSKTADLPALCQKADILVAAIGRANFVKGEWIKEGASVIDVGINRISSSKDDGKKTKLAGDVDFESAKLRAGAITPVPGGVGPMTVACLLANTLTAACLRANLKVPDFSLSKLPSAA